MQWINREKLSRQLLAGTFLNLGSPTAVEVAASMDFDWLLIDLEHGSGSLADLRNLLHACRRSSAAPVVRIPSVDPDTVKFVLDSGAAGIMFPYVSSAEAAQQAVAAMKYPPVGQRGVAGAIRATNYGQDWPTYFSEANANSLVIVQIETPEAVAAADQIAAVNGVDVLFVGPLDLSANLGYAGDFSRPEFKTQLRRVVEACENQSKSAGILTKPGFIQEHKDMGFRLVALGSDLQAVVSGLKNNLRELQEK